MSDNVNEQLVRKGKTMAKMGRETADAMLAEIKAALAPICQKYNVTLARTSGRYDSVQMTVKLELQCLDTEGENAAERLTWNLQCAWLGVEKDDYGRVIPSIGGEYQYKLVGIEPKRPKYPFVGEDIVTHKRYKLTAAAVKWGLEQVKAGK